MASSSCNPIADSATTTSNYYDVFINHRGCDVKYSLATHLYERLNLQDMRAFLDKDELQEGDNIPSHIKAAIRSASVHIPVFSPRYAESTWCLNELLLMLDSGKRIIPIFYGVEPSELRRARDEKGVYGLYLRDLKEKKTTHFQTGQEMQRYDTDIIGKWKEALFQAADFMGFEVEAEACKSDDRELVDRVVEAVRRKLPEPPLHVAKYATGLGHKINDLRLLLSQQSGERSRVVGIVGLGGIGKTTLAKEFFNRERSKYDRSCFVSYIREREVTTSLQSLQSTLVYKLSQSNVQIDSTAEGIEHLRKRASSCYAHALVILDDVDHIRQLDALVDPVKDALRSGSLILVTSRNKDVLASFGIAETSIYHLKGLDRQHSQELFCLHAFGQPGPLVEFETVVGDFLNACKGLPLSLQVIGALLCGNHDLKDWIEQLHKIFRIPPDDIQSVLKISYDSLDEEEKQMFLDIACFFTVGDVTSSYSTPHPLKFFSDREDTDTLKRIWDGSGWGGSLGLRKLQNRCLVNVEGKYLKMHDHVRDLGRYLARTEPLGGHRLWQRTENLPHTLPDQSAVRGICRRASSSSRVEHFLWPGHGEFHGLSYQNHVELSNRSKSISRLELLRTEGDCFEDILSRVQSPEYLIWLSCNRLPYAFLPRWIPKERLTVLQLQGEKLRSLWGDFEAPLKLRELRIMAPSFKFPKSIGQLKYLEKIVVDFQKGWWEGVPLETLPDEFCHLQCLEYLELNQCSELVSLPESFGNLKNLQHISLRGCSNLRTLPNSFGKLINLEYLCLLRCKSLTMSSDTLGNITKLKYICLTRCEQIEVLPPQIIHQRHLADLRVDYTNLKELPSAIVDLRNLERLRLGGPLLETLPARLGCTRSLKYLMIRTSEQLKHLPDSIRELSELVEFIIDGTGLEFLPACIMALNNADASVECMRALDTLILENIKILEVLVFSKGVCPNLQYCYIRNSDMVKIGTLPYSLKDLSVDDCPNLKEIEVFCGHTMLKYLSISFCGKLKSIPGLQQLTNLQSLDVTECDALEDLQGIEHLMWLETLYVDRCPNLQWGEGVLEHLRQREEEGLLKLEVKSGVLVTRGVYLSYDSE